MTASVITNLIVFIAGLLSTNGVTDMDKTAKDVYTLKSNSKVSISFYAHASLMIEYKNQKIYIDPVSEYADYTKEDKADVILVTHEHYDHFDKQAVEILSKENTLFIANPNTVNLYGKGTALKNGDSTQVCGMTIKAFPAYNTTQGRDKFHPKDRDNGYLITIEDLRIYISGDTEFVENDSQINNCDILFLAVNQPYTMTIQQAEKYASQVNPKVFYPYHTTDTDMQQLEKTFEKYGFKTVIHDMK